MPKFLDTRGNASLGIAICDRCKMKFPIGDLYPDPNIPGLRVCEKDMDDFDPWRLPARESDQLVLAFVRPDSPIIPDDRRWVVGGQPLRPSVPVVEGGDPEDPAPDTIIPWEDPNG
jgi:hypothetical protein